MKAFELLDQLTKDGVVFKSDGDSLRIVAKNGYMTPEKLLIVSQHKKELLSLIEKKQSCKTVFRYPPPIFQLQQQGIDVLYDDWLFLSARLPIADEICDQAVKAYISIWHRAMKEEPVAHKKQNVGRKTANTFLRENIKEKI